ncbi:MAG: division/cell wall cluster transcriptional repressor MraZ [Eubacteriaceae bacterium]|nr:division/cell wall cluster transcriptional repressor MraZ [Eubacteriaceae bacterium]
MGSYKNSIDAKYRMIVPSKYREELGLKCVITKGIDKCLYIYPISEWENFAEKLKQLPKADPNARNFVRHFYGNAEECEIDRQGRVTIPQALREYGSIAKELMTIGDGEKIEVWSRNVWDDEQEHEELTADDIARGMEQYGI